MFFSLTILNESIIIVPNIEKYHRQNFTQSNKFEQPQTVKRWIHDEIFSVKFFSHEIKQRNGTSGNTYGNEVFENIS